MSLTQTLRRVARTTAVVAGACALTATRASRQYRLVERRLAILPPGSPDIKLLHLSDLHLYPGREDLATWVARLAREDFDVVISTGDNFGSEKGFELAQRAYAPLLSRPGAFVFGSHDYYKSRATNPLAYLWKTPSGLDPNAKIAFGAIPDAPASIAGTKAATQGGENATFPAPGGSAGGTELNFDFFTPGPAALSLIKIPSPRPTQYSTREAPLPTTGGSFSDNLRENIREKITQPLAERWVERSLRDRVFDFLARHTGHSREEIIECIDGICRIKPVAPGSVKRIALPGARLGTLFTEAGWIDLNNAAGSLRVEKAGKQVHIALSGVDDPHIGRNFPVVGDSTWEDADLRIGLTHSPYMEVLEDFAAEGADLILAGHTHGGQVRVPFFGALVSNCDLPAKYASALFKWPVREAGAALRAAGRQRQKPTWVGVSAGLGVEPGAPWRVACPPSAYLYTLTAHS